MQVFCILKMGMAGAYLNCTGGFQHNSVALQVCTYLVNARLNVNIAFTPVAVLGGGLRGLEHPPRSKFRLQRELTGVINSFSSAKENRRAPITLSVTKVRIFAHFLGPMFA